LSDRPGWKNWLLLLDDHSALLNHYSSLGHRLWLLHYDSALHHHTSLARLARAGRLWLLLLHVHRLLLNHWPSLDDHSALSSQNGLPPCQGLSPCDGLSSTPHGNLASAPDGDHATAPNSDILRLHLRLHHLLLHLLRLNRLLRLLRDEHAGVIPDSTVGDLLLCDSHALLGRTHANLAILNRLSRHLLERCLSSSRPLLLEGRPDLALRSLHLALLHLALLLLVHASYLGVLHLHLLVCLGMLNTGKRLSHKHLLLLRHHGGRSVHCHTLLQRLLHLNWLSHLHLLADGAHLTHLRADKHVLRLLRVYLGLHSELRIRILHSYLPHSLRDLLILHTGLLAHGSHINTLWLHARYSALLLLCHRRRQLLWRRDTD
jgi:hypothetical protein